MYSLKSGSKPQCGHVLKAVLVEQREIGLVCTAKPRGRLDKRVEHRLQIERRPADDLQHVGGGGLLLQGFAQLVEQAGVLDRDDGLAAKFSTSSICLSVNGRTSCGRS